MKYFLFLYKNMSEVVKQTEEPKVEDAKVPSSEVAVQPSEPKRRMYRKDFLTEEEYLNHKKEVKRAGYRRHYEKNREEIKARQRLYYQKKQAQKKAAEKPVSEGAGNEKNISPTN